MNKQDIIISLLKEIDKNIDNVNDSGGTNVNLKELTITANGEYLPADYNADGFSKVKTEINFFKSFLKNTEFTLRGRYDYKFAGYYGGEVIDLSGYKFMNSSVSYMFWAAKVDVNMEGCDTSIITNWTFFSCITDNAKYNMIGCDLSNATKVNRAFECSSLVGYNSIDDVLRNNISVLNGIKISFEMVRGSFDRASLRAVINGLADLTGQTAKELILGETLIAKLTEEDIAIATAKNWTIA